MPRPFTPDRMETREDGRTRGVITMKRACNGCGQLLGDVTDAEVERAIAGLPSLDVRAECDHCRPLVEAEAAGCKTWQLIPDAIRDDAFNPVRRLATGHWVPDEHGYAGLAGITLPDGSGGTLTVLWGDWIIRHPDGRFTIHKAPAEVA